MIEQRNRSSSSNETNYLPNKGIMRFCKIQGNYENWFHSSHLDNQHIIYEKCLEESVGLFNL